MRQIGFIGLGKMGSLVAANLRQAGFKLVMFDTDTAKLEIAEKTGAVFCTTLAGLTKKLLSPRIIFLCIPSGSTTDEVINSIRPQLTAGDTLIDLGNSYYKDTQRRYNELEELDINFIDVGMSGGIDGARNGACLMIGGDQENIRQLSSIFDSISKNSSYKYFGPSGAGHLVKGYHNLIEYGYLQALAEGLESLSEISKQEGWSINLEEVCRLWSQGSIIESRIVRDAVTAFSEHENFDKFSGHVRGETLGEMQHLVALAESHGVKLFASKAAIEARLQSKTHPTISGRIINAIRYVFGGHKD